jgi:hypothetical protein
MTCCFEWSQYYQDPEPAVKRGKKLEVSANGTVDFLDVMVVMEPNLDLNWCRLQNMAQPIIDDTIVGRLAIMSGLWENSLMRLQLRIHTLKCQKMMTLPIWNIAARSGKRDVRSMLRKVLTMRTSLHQFQQTMKLLTITILKRRSKG